VSSGAARLLLAAVGLVALAASTLIVVDPAEVAVVQRFGAAHRVVSAGLGLRLPWPVESVERVRLTEVRRVELPRARLLTGDSNLVELELVAQYSVSDPVAWAFGPADPERLVADLVGAAATSLLCKLPVDVLLTSGRAELQRRLTETVQPDLDRLGTGVHLVGVEVREIVPPEAVQNAFNDVSSARGDQDTLRLAADAYASRLLPDVRGKASERLEVARGRAAEIKGRSEGDVARFEALLPAWRTDPAALRGRLQAELAQTVGPKITIRSLPPGSILTLPPESPR
jgi:membrane protease subunit HflK